MLRNRILVIGLGKQFLDVMSHMQSNFLFIRLDTPEKFNAEIHNTEALIFDHQVFMQLGNIIEQYKGKPIFGIGKGPALEGIQWLNSIALPAGLESLLVETLGTVKAPPGNTGQIEVDTVVKNKNCAFWGPGIVTKYLGDDFFMVKFPKALKLTKKEFHVCHKSTLRLICTIKELSHENYK